MTFAEWLVKHGRDVKYAALLDRLKETNSTAKKLHVMYKKGETPPPPRQRRGAAGGPASHGKFDMAAAMKAGVVFELFHDPATELKAEQFVCQCSQGSSVHLERGCGKTWPEAAALAYESLQRHVQEEKEQDV